VARKLSRASLARKDRRSRRTGGESAVASDSRKNQSHLPKPTTTNFALNRVTIGKTTGSNPPETATYILEMTLALRNVASDSGLDFLAYLLDMAAEEADGLVRAEDKTTAAGPSHEIA